MPRTNSLCLFIVAEQAMAIAVKIVNATNEDDLLGSHHHWHGRTVLAVGRQVLEIAYHLLKEPTTYRELGTDYFDRYSAERLKRRSLAQLQRLCYRVTLAPLPTAA
jgi:hypothetical protein